MRYANLTTHARRIFVAVTFIVLVITIFSVKSYGNDQMNLQSHVAEEKAYRTQLKSVLANYSEANAGITMTKVSLDGIHVEYTVSIHAKEDEKLQKALKDVELGIENATVTINLYES